MTLENEVATATATDAASSVETVETPAPAATETDSTDWESRADAELKDIFQKNNPERSPDGRFAAKDAPAEQIQDQAQAKPPEQQVAAIEPPQSWSAEMKAVFPSLPPAAQEFIAKRESEALTKISQQGQELSQLQPIRSVVEQNWDVFERNGVSPDEGIGRLLSAERLLEQDAPSAIAQIAQAYGVDLAMFAPPANQSEAALRHHIAQLEARLNETSSRIYEREAREAETHTKTVLTEIERFAADKSDWQELETDVLAEITGIRANIEAGLSQPMSPNDILAKAYERAQRNNPTVWAKKQEAERKAAEAKKVEEAQKRAESAKRSNTLNISTPSVSGKASQSWDDDLRASYRKANSK